MVSRSHLLARKKRIYRHIYDFTRNKCELCAKTGCKCTDRICGHVESCAKKQGVSFIKGNHNLRFIVEQGCSVPPEYRETCTLYLCDYAIKKANFPGAYYQKLLKIAGRIEMQLMEAEVGKK